MGIAAPLTRRLTRQIVRSITDPSGGGSFSPASLFSGGEQGVIFDNTVSSGIAATTGGTGEVVAGGQIAYTADASPSARPATQATAANRPIWRGSPRTLGAEIVSNGRMASDTVWTKGAGWTIGSGVATKAAGTGSGLSQAISVTAGATYVLFFNITRSAGTIAPQLTGGTAVVGISRSESGSYQQIFTAASGNTTIDFVADAAFAGTLDNVTIKPAASFTNMGAYFDGVNDALTTAAVDLSATDKATIVWSCRYEAPTGGTIAAFEVGNYYSNVTGSAAGTYGSQPNMLLRGNTAQAGAALPNAEGQAVVPRLHVNTMRIDLAQGTILTEIVSGGRGILTTNTTTGSTAGGGNMVNGAVNIGRAANDFLHWSGLHHRFVLINRTLTAPELAQTVAWVRAGMAFCAVIGDSTVAVTNSGVGLPISLPVAPLTGGMVTGAADVSFAGDTIAAQKTKWTALPEKGALQAVFIQVGLNDVRGRIGANTATSAQVIADLQDLVDTVSADTPAGCKIVVSQMTPAKLWLDGATNPTAAYQGWLDVNEAIAGSGGTPIIGVDYRVTSHVAALNDGSGNLLQIYDQNGDGVHESNEARFIIAQAWRDALESMGLV